MTLADILPDDIAETAQILRARAEPFAFATIIRTAGATAAKPGAKAILGPDGTILQGWLGGGCTRGAVKRAALQALREGTPQLISVAPQELLAKQGVSPGDQIDGTTFARNGCPSKGTVDIFIEPCLPKPALAVIGASPVAKALSTLAPQFDWALTASLHETVIGPAPYIVIATQGQGDLDALKSALSTPAPFIAFVGSRRKFATLAEKLTAAGHAEADIARVHAPAGLDLGAVTPEEIALSILAQLVQVRRKTQTKATA